MESIYTEFALHGSNNECARTDNIFFLISEICNGTVSLKRNDLKKNFFQCIPPKLLIFRALRLGRQVHQSTRQTPPTRGRCMYAIRNNSSFQGSTSWSRSAPVDQSNTSHAWTIHEFCNIIITDILWKADDTDDADDTDYTHDTAVISEQLFFPRIGIGIGIDLQSQLLYKQEQEQFVNPKTCKYEQE